MSQSELRSAIEAAFRDFTVANVPASGAHEPDKSEIRAALGKQLEIALSSVGAGIGRYATIAAMDADHGQVDGALAYVYNNNGTAADAANGIYQWKLSASDWVRADWYFNAVSSIILDGAEEARDEAVAAAEAAKQFQFSEGNVLGRATPVLQLFEMDPLPNSPWGISYPVGVEGRSANIFVKLPFDGASNKGLKRIELSLKTSATFTRVVQVLFFVEVNGAQEGREAVITPTPYIGSARTVLIEYEVRGDETGLWPFILTQASPITASVETIEVVDLRVYALEPRGFGTAADDVFETLRGELLDAAAAGAVVSPSATFDRILTVKPSGGDYTHPVTAIAAASGAAGRPAAVRIGAGTYTGQAEWHTKDNVHLIGIGRKEDVVLSYANTTGASAATIKSTSLFWQDTDTTIANVTGTIRRGRYVNHLETGGAKPFSRQAIINCHFEHLGNDDAVNNDWPQASQIAVGSGLSDGQVVVVRGSTLIGPGGGFSYHTQNVVGPAYAPTFVDLEGNTFVSTVPGLPCLKIVPIIVGAGDQCRLVGNSFSGPVMIETTQWVSPDTTTRRDQIDVWGYGNTPTLYQRVITGPAAGQWYYPRILDEETMKKNGTGAPITRGKVLAHDGNPNVVRVMTDADQAWQYAGIALEDIAAGALGRVKTDGWLELGVDVFFSSGPIGLGQRFSIDPTTPGRLAPGGALGLLPVVYSVAGIVGVKVAA